MKVRVLGTSCTWYERENTCYLIDDKIMLDFSSGAYKVMIKYVTPFDIDAVLITHQHLDHIGDLRVLLAKTVWFSEKRKSKLKVFSPKGTLQKTIALNKLFYASHEEQSSKLMKKVVDFVDLKDGMTFELGEYFVTVYKMEHGAPETFGFTFKDKSGKVVGFSADTEVCENLHKILSCSDAAFVEVSLSKKRNLHISTDEFVELVKSYPNCKIFPVHTTDDTQNFVEANDLNALHDEDLIDL